MTSILITGIVIYAIGAFLTALAIGFFDMFFDMDDDFGWFVIGWFVIGLWPLTLIFIGVLSLGDAIEEWVNKNPSAAHRIGSILDHITIPFRPITLGRRIREWLDNRRIEIRRKQERRP